MAYKEYTDFITSSGVDYQGIADYLKSFSGSERTEAANKTTGMTFISGLPDQMLTPEYLQMVMPKRVSKVDAMPQITGPLSSFSGFLPMGMTGTTGNLGIVSSDELSPEALEWAKNESIRKSYVGQVGPGGMPVVNTATDQIQGYFQNPAETSLFLQESDYDPLRINMLSKGINPNTMPGMTKISPLPAFIDSSTGEKNISTDTLLPQTGGDSSTMDINQQLMELVTGKTGVGSPYPTPTKPTSTTDQAFQDWIKSIEQPYDEAMNLELTKADRDMKANLADIQGLFLDRGLGGSSQITDIEANQLAQAQAMGAETKAGIRSRYSLADQAKKQEAYKERFGVKAKEDIANLELYAKELGLSAAQTQNLIDNVIKLKIAQEGESGANQRFYDELSAKMSLAGGGGGTSGTKSFTGLEGLGSYQPTSNAYNKSMKNIYDRSFDMERVSSGYGDDEITGWEAILMGIAGIPSAGLSGIAEGLKSGLSSTISNKIAESFTSKSKPKDDYSEDYNALISSINSSTYGNDRTAGFNYFPSY